MQVISSYYIPSNVGRVRLLDYALAHMELLNTRNSVKKAIKRGLLLLDGKRVESGRFIQAGQLIELLSPDVKAKVFELKFSVVYENEYLAVINKPAGYGVSGNYFKTIQNALLFNLTPSGLPDALPLPLPVHRLDNPTSGLLLIAKTQSARANLGKQFEDRLIKKKYHAIVIGTVEKNGEINSTIKGKNAQSKYIIKMVVESKHYGSLTLLELEPITGRTHQLRIHMAEINHPILGDREYGDPEKAIKGKGLFLCSTSLSFVNPEKGAKKCLSLELPAKFKKQLYL